MIAVRHKSFKPSSFSNSSMASVTLVKVFLNDCEPLPAFALYFVKYSSTAHRLSNARQSMLPRLARSKCASKELSKGSLRARNKFRKPGR